jgi:hypothetical protein
MRRLFTKSDLQSLGALMALAVLTTTLPLSVGTVVVSRHGQPQITENICQPLQTFNVVLNTLLARPAPGAPDLVLYETGSAPQSSSARPVDNREAPDTPPPRLV